LRPFLKHKVNLKKHQFKAPTLVRLLQYRFSAREEIKLYESFEIFTKSVRTLFSKQGDWHSGWLVKLI